ncbi:MAG: MBL fold metallo-hydrolase, partial [Firmicutes bacterium]|nr:MBL fold metallo-hydrolase [Bacillota bacterium]
MKIQYLGHSCFRLISEMGTTIVCDPYEGDTVGFDMPRVRADAVTVSHHHKDHDCTDNIMGSYAELDAEITVCADDVEIVSIPTFHDEVKGAKRGNNLVFKFNIDGLTVVHMGDVGCFDENLVKQIYGCDVLMIPVGGVYTVNAEVAKKYVDAVCPKTVIPMHYGTPYHKFDLDGIDNFLSLFDPAQVKYLQNDGMSL